MYPRPTRLVPLPDKGNCPPLSKLLIQIYSQFASAAPAIAVWKIILPVTVHAKIRRLMVAALRPSLVKSALFHLLQYMVTQGCGLIYKIPFK